MLLMTSSSILARRCSRGVFISRIIGWCVCEVRRFLMIGRSARVVVVAAGAASVSASVAVDVGCCCRRRRYKSLNE